MPDPWPYIGIEKKIFLDMINILTVWPYGPHPLVWTPDPGAVNLTVSVEGFIGITTMDLVFTLHAR